MQKESNDSSVEPPAPSLCILQNARGSKERTTKAHAMNKQGSKQANRAGTHEHTYSKKVFHASGFPGLNAPPKVHPPGMVSRLTCSPKMRARLTGDGSAVPVTFSE